MAAAKSHKTKPIADTNADNCSLCNKIITEDDFKSGNININEVNNISHRHCQHKSNNSGNNNRDGCDQCYGILMDVSGSMQGTLTTNRDLKLQKNQISGAHAVFSSIFKVMKENKNKNEKVFVLAFGLSDAHNQHCDLFSLFEYLVKRNGTLTKEKYIAKKKAEALETIRQYGLGYESLISLAKNNGAPYAGEYIRKHLTMEQAGYISLHFDKHPDLMRTMIDELPDACKKKVAHVAVSATNSKKTSMGVGVGAGLGVAFTILTGGAGGLMLAGVAGAGLLAQSQTKKAEDDAAKKALQRARQLIESRLRNDIKQEIDQELAPIYDIRKQPRSREEIGVIMKKLKNRYALNSVDDMKDGESVDINKLLDDIKPYIFGGTPMCQSIENAQYIFQRTNNYTKTLLIISDGEATDGSPEEIATQLHDVRIVSCFTTTEHIENPRQLYDKPNSKWSEGANALFNMSSFVSNMDPGVHFLLERGWELPASGQSKLFIQANHPDIIDEFCCIINLLSNDNDAIIDMIGKYEFDKYINAKISETEAPDQGDTPTCYSNAVPTVLHLAASKEWLDRGIPDFITLRDTIIEENKGIGANTKKVLQKYCAKYGLICEKIQDAYESIARKVIFCKRAMVFVFRLYNAQWRLFKYDFYKNNKKGILTKDDLKIEEWEKKEGSTGHAVVLVKCEPNCLVFMNSWGTEWADNGFFRVKSKNVLHVKTRPTFFDVRNDQLSEKEKQAYKAYCKEEAQSVIHNNVSSAFYETEYKCQECGETSTLNEYGGSFMNVICPKCGKSFKPTVAGLIKGLYQQGMKI